MRGSYTANIKLSALAASKTLLMLTAPSTAAVEIFGAKISNSSNSNNQQLEAYLQRVTTVGSAAGTSITPAKNENGDQAAGSTVIGGLTVEPTTYTANTKIGDMGFSNIGGYFYQPTPEERPVVPPSGVIGLFLNTVPTSTDFEVEITFREIG